MHATTTPSFSIMLFAFLLLEKGEQERPSSLFCRECNWIIFYIDSFLSLERHTQTGDYSWLETLRVTLSPSTPHTQINTTPDLQSTATAQNRDKLLYHSSKTSVPAKLKTHFNIHGNNSSRLLYY